MGCNDSRKGYSQEEIALEAKEAEFCFYTKYSDELLRSFAYYAQNGVISPKALSEAFSEMGLPPYESNDGLKRVLERFRRDGDGYELRKVQILSILLGAPRGDLKARAVFKLYDQKDEYCLSVTTIAQMCHDLITISTDDLGCLDSSSRMQNYLSGLKLLREDFVKEMLSHIAGTEADLPREKFIAAISSLETSKYLAAGTLRVALAEYKKMSSIRMFRKKEAREKAQ